MIGKKVISKSDGDYIEQMLLDVIDYSSIRQRTEYAICALIEDDKIHDSQTQTIDENLKQCTENDFCYTIYCGESRLWINVYRY